MNDFLLSTTSPVFHAIMLNGLTIFIVLWSVYRWRSLTWRDLCVVGSAAAGYAFFTLAMPWKWVALAACIVGAAAGSVGNVSNASAESEPFSPYERRVLAGLILASVVFLQGYHLGSYSMFPLTWESTVLAGMEERMRMVPPIADQLRQFFLWHEGTLSTGDESLLFGAPLFFFSRFFEVSLASVRLISVVWMTIAVILFGLLVRRTCGASAAVVALLVFGLNEVILIYGRYGSSIAGTMCASVAAIYFCVRLIERADWRCVIPATMCLFFATLGYSPARVGVLLTALYTTVALMWAPVGIRRRSLVSLLFIISLIPPLWWQWENGHLARFHSGRGEQLFGMVGTSFWPHELESLASLECLRSKQVSLGETIGVGIELVRRVTAQQFITLVQPSLTSKRFDLPFYDDPPYWRLYAPILVPFLCIGFFGMWRKGRRHLGGLCLALGVLGPLPLLFTNRVDTHRLVFLIIPLSVWITVGIADVLQTAHKARLRYGMPFLGLLVALCYTVVPRWNSMFERRPAVPVEESSILRAVSGISGPVTLLTAFDHKIANHVGLKLMNQERRSGVVSQRMPEEFNKTLEDLRIEGSAAQLDVLFQRTRSGHSIILAPSGRYTQAAAKLQEEGLVVRLHHAGHFKFWVVSAPTTTMSKVVGEIVTVPPPLSPLVRPSPAEFGDVREVDVTELTPTRSHHTFAPWRLNESFSGEPIRWPMVKMQGGIGTHAVTTLEYAVPPGAIGFQSWVGISYGAANCEKASAVVRIVGDSGAKLYETRVMHATEQPQFISLKLENVTRLIIEVADGGDGIDCDHVNIGEPRFLIPTKP